MKIHLAWIRTTAAAALFASVGVYPAAAQYAPFKPIPPDPVAPATAQAPAAPYGAYGTQPTYPQTAYPQTQYQAPAARYQAPATAYQPAPAAYRAAAAPVAQYAQPPVAYPQTASRYPAAYPYVAQNQPTEATLPPPQGQGPGPGNGNSSPAAEMAPATSMPVEQGMAGAPAASGYPAAAGCGCGASGYTAAGCGSTYPDVSNYFGNECGGGNQWFGGVYWLDMERSGPHPRVLSVEVPDGTARPYYPQSSVTFISTANAEPDFRNGVEVRLGSTFTVGGAESCGCGGNGYGYTGCGCNSCASCNSTQYAWEVAWWGLDHDVNDYTRTDELTGATSHMYGMQNFNGAEYDKGSTGTWRPVNDYYDYQMPINTGPPYANGTEVVLSQRVYTNFSAQNLELNIMRFPVCDTGCGGCSSGCGSSAYDTCGCNSGCGCCQAPKSSLTMYGSCGVRYFRTDDDFSFDTEAATADGAGGYDKTMPTGDFDVCYDVNIDNNLIGPQIGWTTDYCVCCRWNFFWNSTFGIFGNHIDQSQRLWSPNGDVRFQQSGDSVDIHNSRNDIAFLGELRAGCSYDINCHWRAVLAYRAIAMTGVATAFGQIPDNFSNESEVGHINTDNSLVIHGVQTGVECRY